MTNQEIKTTPEWVVIDPDESNYINFHMYCEIQDWLGRAFARRLQESNDSMNNHALSTLILQGFEYEYITGSRFTRWLKKKLVKSKPPEILRMVFDDYHTDVDMTAVEYYYPQLFNVLSERVSRLISKSKVSFRERLEQAAEEHKAVLEYLKDK